MNTSTTPKHAAEPWIVSHDGEGPAIRSQAVQPDWQSYVAQVKESATSEEDRANAARIVQCVNACANIPDPAAALVTVRKTLSTAAMLQRAALRMALADEEVTRKPQCVLDSMQATLLDYYKALAALGDRTHLLDWEGGGCQCEGDHHHHKCHVLACRAALAALNREG